MDFGGFCGHGTKVSAGGSPKPEGRWDED